MRKMKTLVALVLVAMMSLALVGSAMADNTALTITSNISGETGSVYKGYELLKVTAVSGTNYTYEVNPKYASILSANLTGNPTTNIDVYNAIAGLSNIAEWSETILAAIKTAGLEADATITGGSATIEQGYWLIEESTAGTIAGLPEGYNSSTSKILVNTAGQATMTITTKESIPTVDKKITGVNETDTNSTAEAVKVGDKVEFTLTGTLGSNLRAYKDETTGTYKYYFEFVDTMGDGLELVSVDSVTISGTGATLPAYTQTPTNSATAGENAGGHSLSIKWDNLLAGLTTDEAVAAFEGKVITVVYTAEVTNAAVITDAGNPNTVKLVYTNNPYTNDHGESVPVTVKVYTFNLIINKVQPDGNDDGTDPDPLNGAGFTLYYKATSAGDYAVVGSGEIKHDDSNVFTWAELAPGYYKLVETTVPSGFTKMNDYEFEITEDVSSGRTLNCSSSLAGAQVDSVAGTITADILNQQGTPLPTTGGIGTTLFYIAGIVLVLGAAAVIIARRKAEQE